MKSIRPLPLSLSLSLQSLFLASALLATQMATAQETGLDYTVVPGDTLIRLGQRYLLQPRQWPAVQQLNRIADPHRLKPGSIVRIPPDLLRRAAGEAALESVNGPVQWRRADAAWQDAKSGERLGAGTEINTGEGASALLLLPDGSRVLLAPQSNMVLDMLNLYGNGAMVDSRVRLQQGQADITANPAKKNNMHLQIRTPSAQTVVRGTRFRVGAGADLTREETLQGAVAVSAAGGSVNVRQGQGTAVKPGGKPLAPLALLPAPDTAGLPRRFERLPMRFPLPRQAGAKHWFGEIAPDDSFSQVLLDKNADTGALSFADLPDGDYVLRLRAADEFGLQGFDALHRFTVFARPFAPGINAPGDAATVRDARAPFAWTRALDVARYRLQVSAQPDFSAPLHDAATERTDWQPPADLPPGRLYWRIASIVASGRQGPWSAPAAFVYNPAPGAVDTGRMSIRLEDSRIRLGLDAPPAGMSYKAVLSADAGLAPALQAVQSGTGDIELAQPQGGAYYLGIGLVDNEDGTAGPMAVRPFDVPAGFPWPVLLLLLPLL